MTNHTLSTNISRLGRRRALALSSGIVVGSIGLAATIGGGQASAIVDGEPTSADANPWQVALTSADGEQVCGGSVVSDRVIVTAAHCTEGTPAGELQIRAGVTDLATDNGQTRNVAQVIEHPKYLDGVGDIAMLVLDRPLEFSATVAPIELANAADIATAETARVTGWGVTGENADDSPSVLRGTDVPLVSDADCGLIDAGNDDELCAGGTGTDSCYGDSGGPLTVATNDGQKLAGVVSWGDECGGESAGVYAEVPTFATWIAERVADPDAPVGERLPAGDEQFDDIDFGDDQFDDDQFDDEPQDAEYVEIDDAFFDEYSDAELDAMSDEDFWDAVEPYLIDDSDDVGMTEDFDTNGDDIVQWSEFDPTGAEFFDANDDGIVNWSELIDA